jgi:betaine-aldehyde dehydrogenase
VTAVPPRRPARQRTGRAGSCSSAASGPPPVDGHVADVISPSTEEAFAQAALAGATDIARAVDAARAAFESGPWPRTTPAERAGILLRMADGLEERAGVLRYLSAAECGATVPIADAFASSGPSLLRHYAEAIGSYRTTEEVAGLFSRAEVRRVPLGVCGIIVPWNSPLSIALFSVTPALAAGCSVVVKSPAETRWPATYSVTSPPRPGCHQVYSAS